jgi:hypothetical protein
MISTGMGGLRNSLGDASEQPPVLLLITERRNDDQTGVMGARDLNEFLVCGSRLHDRLNVNPKASSYLACLFLDLLA